MSSNTSWFSSPKPNPRARLRLFCFPYAGGDAVIYRSWPEMLPAEIEISAAQLPGRGRRMREVPYTALMPLVEAMSDAILPHLDRPFAFFGHSMGAMIAFELARHLRERANVQPVHLFVSGRPAPQIPRVPSVRYDAPEPEFIEELRSLEGTPPEVFSHPELMQLMLPLLRADFSVVHTYAYAPAPPLDCPITAIGGLLDEEANREHLEAWREHTNAAFKVRMLQGNHFFLNTQRALLLSVIAQELRQHIS
ncbi:MAG TPA: alpha/beta fold hydrolase [Pyrinomonadaceae bacterium]|nr:alpha/beta fold hydrolase [Pyrinomonadaceae bacterium]